MADGILATMLGHRRPSGTVVRWRVTRARGAALAAATLAVLESATVSTASASSRASFTSAANGICSTANHGFGMLGILSSAAGAAKAAASLVALTQTELSGLKRLTPPAADAARYGRALVDLGQEIPFFKAAEAVSKDPITWNDDLGKAASPALKGQLLMRGMGLSACLFYGASAGQTTTPITKPSTTSSSSSSTKPSAPSPPLSSTNPGPTPTTGLPPTAGGPPAPAPPYDDSNPACPPGKTDVTIGNGDDDTDDTGAGPDDQDGCL
jgi:hypothetical protein